ncbi:hypothetical protein [Pengzhenrongella phosphoraccumulans]|uniref:hypothetical protein n=1 Tax=Pengzhenrongella phosphoraccumulans TaxID=3114394 RepID=UPI003890E53B
MAIGFLRESYLSRIAPWIHRLHDLTERSVVCHTLMSAETDAICGAEYGARSPDV